MQVIDYIRLCFGYALERLGQLGLEDICYLDVALKVPSQLAGRP
jgi:hypothetical protein